VSTRTTRIRKKGDGPQLLNLYTCIREPVEPASTMSAYWTSGMVGV
jgi:hypothetical protein